MSDTESKLLARLAAMETELAALRKPAPQSPPAPAFDVGAFVRDPVGSMSKMGIPIDHVTRVLVANTMGDQAPPELKVLAAMGPQMSAVHALSSQTEALSRQFSELVSAQKAQGRTESWKALTSDKSKYPHLAKAVTAGVSRHLAKAVTADPSLFDDELSSHGGTAEELATRLEAKLAKVAAVIAPPPASEANAVVPAQSQQSAPAPVASTTSGGVPPIPQQPAGTLTPEAQRALREEIIRKYSK